MLNGESFQPCSLKIGPSRNGRQTSSTPALPAASSTRKAAGYEYVLPNSNQNSTRHPYARPTPPSALLLTRLTRHGCQHVRSASVTLRFGATIEKIDDAGLQGILRSHHYEPIPLDELFQKLRTMPQVICRRANIRSNSVVQQCIRVILPPGRE